MSTEQVTCSSCGTVFYTDIHILFRSNKCNVCIQTERLENQAELSRQQALEMQERRDAIETQHLSNLTALAQAKLEAIERQTKVISEGSISSKSVYQRGYNYIDIEFINNNLASLQITVNEDGTLNWVWNHIYLTDRLQEEFRNGLNKRLLSLPTVEFEILNENAKQAGRQNADGSLPSIFSLYTGLELNGYSIPSISFNSNFTSTLDEDTGEIKMNWKPPFTDQRLNQSYLEGVNELHWEVNTEINKFNRLQNEVVAIKKHRKKTRIIKNKLGTYKILLWLIPLFLSIFIIYSSKEWTSYFYLLLILPLIVILVRALDYWERRNWEYLGNVSTLNQDERIDDLTFFELGDSEKFTSLSLGKQFSYRLKNHPILTITSWTTFILMFYLAIFKFNLPNELKINLDLLLTKISKSNSGQGQPETLNESNNKESANLIKPAQVQLSIPTASLEDAVKAIEGEIDYSFNKPLLTGIYGFEKRYPVFNTAEGIAEVERLNNLIAEKIKNLN